MAAARFELLTPRPGAGAGARGAIACIVVAADDPATLADAATRLGVRLPDIGDAIVVAFGEIDVGVAARWNERSCHLMPHGGARVIRSMLAWLADADIERAASAPDAFPEATSAFEARLLALVALAPSPRAVPLLLDQVHRQDRESVSPSHRRLLDRLMTPPVVLAIGPPNVGKSTLVNRLAGRRVAVAADTPGVTRDHVGVSLIVDGLAIRWVDLPGVREAADPRERTLESAAWAAAAPVLEAASLVVQCADSESPFVDAPPAEVASDAAVLRCGLKADLGPVAGAEIEVSAMEDRGVLTLCQTIRRRLVSDEALTDPGRWLPGGPAAPCR
ncbi:MAG: GTPase [Phycisphaerales bacterium]